MSKKLALFGGEPVIPIRYRTFQHPRIDVSQTSIMSELSDTMISYEGNGITKQFESVFADFFSLENTLSFNSGTNALFALYYGAGLKEGDEVLVPGFTFFATATPLFLLKCRPVLVDCTPNGNMDPEDIVRKITPRTRAIVVTHVWGFPCEMDKIQKISKEHNLLLFEDASHAHGATMDGRHVGSFGDGAAWSLGAKKLLTGGQGGILATPHRGIFERALLVGHYNRRALSQVEDIGLFPFAETGTGLNLRMHPYAAATLLEQMKSYGDQLAERRETAEMLIEGIKSIPGLETLPVDPRMDPSWYAFPLQYNKKEFKGVSKETFVKALQAEGALEADIPGTTCPLNRFFAFQVNFTGQKVPNSDLQPTNQSLPACDKYSEVFLKLPTWYGPDRLQYTEYYIKSLEKVVKNCDELKNI